MIHNTHIPDLSVSPLCLACAGRGGRSSGFGGGGGWGEPGSPLHMYEEVASHLEIEQGRERH